MGLTERRASHRGRVRVAGSESELELRLLHDEWTDDETQLTSLLRAGLRSLQSEPTGFNAVLQPMLTVARRSDTLVSVMVPTSAQYAIIYPESLSLTVAPGATRAARGAHSAFNLVVRPAAGSVVLTDANSLYLQLDKSEALVRDKRSIDLQLALSDDTLSLDLGEDTNASRLLIEGIASLQSGTNGWNNIVQRTMSYTSLTRVDDTHLLISIPQAADYDITGACSPMLSSRIRTRRGTVCHGAHGVTLLLAPAASVS
jgi:hypothetical protein